jgi:TELO2-interacting protein 1
MVQLKPVCVDLSQSALRLMGSNGNVPQVLSGLDKLLTTLRQPDISSSLDPSLAEYAFFPLSHVLRQLEKLPLRAQELTLSCISVLLKNGWKSKVNTELGMQLIILVSFLIDPKDGKNSPVDNTEDLKNIGLSCMTLVFEALSESQEGRDFLSSLSNVPHIGKALSVILDLSVQTTNESLRVSTLVALRSFCKAWPDLNAMSSRLFPGIVSNLNKMLTSSAGKTIGFKALVLAIEILSDLITSVLADTRTKDLPEQAESSNKSTEMSQAWLKATSGQVKLALSNILKLRRHEKAAVRIALVNLCTKCLENCWYALSDSREMLLETLVVFSTTESEARLELKHLMAYKDDISGILRTNLYNGIVSLPRISLSPDDLVRQRSFQQISQLLQVLSDQGEQLSIAEDLLATNVRDAVINTIKTTSKPKISIENEASTSEMSLVSLQNQSRTTFEEIFSSSQGQFVTFGHIRQFLSSVSSRATLLSIARYLALNISGGGQNDQVGSLWILNLLLQKLSEESNWSDGLTLDLLEDTDVLDIAEQVYSNALAILTEPESSIRDWRLQALALEAIAFQAQQLKEDFQEELIDCLYPVVQCMASPNEFVQQHAITCLNILAEQCGYGDSGSLIVGNVDYLVNSVGIQLNTFNLSPQAPMILVMMIRLAGSSLLPFLDDLVDSIFSALESYHGYPKLVDLLFTALSSIVEEGVHSPHIAITHESSVVKRRPKIWPTVISDLIEAIKDSRQKEDKELSDSLKFIEDAENHDFPKEPWKLSPKIKADDSTSSISGDEQDNIDDHNQEHETNEDGEQQLSKSHSLLLSITKLTQHYLTTSSLSLRIRLLTLLKTSIPVLAADENSFLPLVNTLWPVVLSRVQDDETFVVAGALDVIALMCTNAGSFMTSRINETWKQFRQVHARCVNNVPRAQPKPSLDLGKDSPWRIINKTGTVPKTSSRLSEYHPQAPSGSLWNSFVGVMKAIAVHVPIAEYKFDEMVEFLLPVIQVKLDVKEALETRNPDTVWLAVWRLNSFEPGSKKSIDY